jgi:hypothetical protein
MIDVRKDVVDTIWGDIDDAGKRGQHGKTSDTVKPKGKEGTAAYMTGVQNAEFDYNRQIRKKLEEGYVEVGLDGKPLLGEAQDTIDHTRALPKNLCFSKPKSKVKDGYLQTLDAEKRAVYTRKVNGMMLIAHVRSDHTVHLYSRRMDSLTQHFPHLIQALGVKGLMIPPETVFLFEAYMGNGNDKRDLKLCSSVMRSKHEKALERQRELGWMNFYLLRTPVVRGEHLEGTKTMGNLIEAMENSLADKFISYRDPEGRTNEQFLFTMETFEGTATEALDTADRLGYEGWVGYVKDAILGDKSYSFHGKPDRPSTCFKLKNEEEDDFIAYWNPDKGTKERPMGEWGTGKNQGLIGSMSLYQIDSEGKEVYCGEVGSGLTDEQRKKLSNPKHFPKVAKIVFEERFYKSMGDPTNALQLPRLDDFREDKGIKECINADLT